VLEDPDNRRALYERLQFAMMDVPDAWHQPEQARVDERQFIPVASL
jgi:nitrite reductase (NADH) large subunit